MSEVSFCFSNASVPSVRWVWFLRDKDYAPFFSTITESMNPQSLENRSVVSRAEVDSSRTSETRGWESTKFCQKRGHFQLERENTRRYDYVDWTKKLLGCRNNSVHREDIQNPESHEEITDTPNDREAFLLLRKCNTFQIRIFTQSLSLIKWWKICLNRLVLYLFQQF